MFVKYIINIVYCWKHSLEKKKIITFPLQAVACDFLLGPSNRGQARLAGACSQANLVAVERLMHLLIHSLSYMYSWHSRSGNL